LQWLMILSLLAVVSDVCVDASEAKVVAAPRAKPSLAVQAPAAAPRLLQGGNDKNEKDDEKDNKNKETESPSQVPSYTPTPEPTTEAPTQFPTGRPSASPTDTMAPSPSPSLVPSETVPTTPVPTDPYPTSSPTMAYPFDKDDVLGYLEIAVAVDTPWFTASDIDNGNAHELVETVKAGITEALCAGTEIQVVGTGGTKRCDPVEERSRFFSRRYLELAASGISNEDDDDESVMREDHLLLFAADRSHKSTSWILWKHQYPVMSVGSAYRVVGEDETVVASETEGGSSPDRSYGEYLETPENSVSSILLMQAVAQQAVNERMGDLNVLLSDLDTRVAVVGTEETAFALSKYETPLDPPMLHSLRLAGIILLCTVLLIAGFFVKVAGARKREREWDLEFMERGKGGLVTEEGLDYMLEVGRSKTTETSPTQSGESVSPRAGSDEMDQDARALPLPSQYSMNVNVYSSFHSAETQRAQGGGASQYAPGIMALDTANEDSIEMSTRELLSQVDGRASEVSAKTDWGDYDYDDLPKHIQKAARRLGYTPSMWNNDEEPAACDKYWHRLTKGQQEAAMLLGYNQNKWDDEDDSSSSSD